MNKYLDSSKDIYIKEKLEPFDISPEEENLVDQIAKDIAEQQDKIIAKILNDMGITREFMIAHREDFLMIETGITRQFYYKNKPLFTEICCMDYTKCVYKYEIYQKGKVV